MFAELRRFVRRLIGAVAPTRAEDELQKEIAAHLALLEDEFLRRGLPPDQARAAARRAFGGVARAQDAHRDARSFPWLDDARIDVRYAARTLLRAPGFTLSAVATLALGIGASTAIFSVVYGVSLRRLPYPEPERLVRIYEADVANGRLEHEVSLGAFHEWRQRVPSIESAAIYSKGGVRFVAGEETAPLATRTVSPAFFDVLGVKPLLGPGFKPERDYTRFTADDEVVLSFSAWQRLFGGRPEAIGATLTFSGVGDDDAVRVVGVMPEGFAFEGQVDVWWPTEIVELPISRLLRLWRYDHVVARLRPGASIEQTRTELQAVSAALGAEFPKTNAGWTATIEPLHDAIVGTFARAAWLVLAAVGVVLLVTCLNVGSLLVARAAARERETAVRAALGAGPGRLLRLWLAEAALIGGLGGALGVALAWSGIRALVAAAPPAIPRLESIALDIPSLTMAAGASLLAVVLLTAARRRPAVDALRQGATTGGRRVHALRTLLSVTQCAGAAALVVLAVMLARSFVRLTSVDLGWDPAGVLSFSASPPVPRELRRPWALYVEWSDRLIARLEATPGIHRAAVTTQIPLSGRFSPATLARGRGRTATDGARWPGVQHVVSDGYFEIMGIDVVSGRGFGASDRFTAAQLIGASDRPERGVAVVSNTTARTLWPGRSPLGEAIWLPDIDTVAWREVVGVVEDIQFHGVGERPALHVFVPWTQYQTGGPRMVVKGVGEAASIVELVKSVVGEVAPGTQIDRVATLEGLVWNATAQPRFTSGLVAAFGALALLLAAIGIYGTLSFLVAGRSREFGIRLALGATPRSVVALVVRRGVLPAAAGLAAGVAVALLLARAFRAVFFQVEVVDPGSLAAGAVILLAVAALAALAPARRASRVDPSVALRVD